MGDPRGDVETRMIRKLIHLDMHDLNLVCDLVTALASEERVAINNRSVISQKLITTVQEIKQIVNKKQIIATSAKYPKRR